MQVSLALSKALIVGMLLALGTATPSLGHQASASKAAVTEIHNIIVPQARRTMRHRHIQAVELTAVDIKLGIDDQLATTTMQLTLSNPANRPQQTEMLVPVPDGVTIRSVQYDGTGLEPIAKLLPRDEARSIYDSIVRKSLDPALVEFAGYNLIRTSAFPIPANGSQKLTITFEQVLLADGDRIDYVLPRSESLAESDVAWTIKASIGNSKGIASVYSPSHDLVVEKHGDVRVSAASAAGRPLSPGAFRLSYLRRPANVGGVSATLFAYPDASVNNGQGGYFLMLASLPKRMSHQQPKREVILVLDRSGSMEGAKIEQARKAAIQVIEGLAMGESFNIIDYSDSIQSFSRYPVVKTAETAAEARSYISQIQAQGGTNIHDALLEAVRVTPTSGTLPMVLFLTDGLPTVGERSEVAIRDAVKKANMHKRRIFSFGVGYDANAPLLSTIAQSSKAASTVVLPEEDVEIKVSQVFARLRGPMLVGPKLMALDGDSVSTRLVREMQPSELNDVFENDEILVLGQYTTDQTLRFRLTGHEATGEDRVYEMTFQTSEASARNGFVPRIWATRKIAALTDEIRQSSAGGSTPNDPRTKELVDEIIRLSTRWGVMTEYTSFLATDEDAPLASFREEVTADGRIAVSPAEPAAPARAYTRARERISSGNEQRAGKEGAMQQLNYVGRQQAQTVSGAAANIMLDKDMKQVRIAGVQQVADRSLFRRGGRWVDSALGGKEDAAPDATVEFGTDAYSEIVVKLTRQGRQGLLAMGGDVYLSLEGRRILVKGPAATPEAPKGR